MRVQSQRSALAFAHPFCLRLCAAVLGTGLDLWEEAHGRAGKSGPGGGGIRFPASFRKSQESVWFVPNDEKEPVVPSVCLSVNKLIRASHDWSPASRTALKV